MKKCEKRNEEQKKLSCGFSLGTCGNGTEKVLILK